MGARAADPPVRGVTRLPQNRALPSTRLVRAAMPPTACHGLSPGSRGGFAGMPALPPHAPSGRTPGPSLDSGWVRVLWAPGRPRLPRTGRRV